VALEWSVSRFFFLFLLPAADFITIFLFKDLSLKQKRRWSVGTSFSRPPSASVSL